MKNLLFLLLILVSCVSCEKDINTYEGDSGIYFADEGTLLIAVAVAAGIMTASSVYGICASVWKYCKL